MADARSAVQVPQFIFQLRQVFGIYEVDLVEQHHVGESDLFLGLRRIAQLLKDMLGIDDGNHAVERVLGLDLVVDEKTLDHRRGIGQTGGLNH